MEEMIKLSGFMSMYTTKSGQIYKRNRRGLFKRIEIRPVTTSYPSITGISDLGKPVKRVLHRVIMETLFPVPGMENLVVNHKNFNKNDYSLENLEWVTRSRNTKHYFESLGFEYAEDGSTIKKWDKEKAAKINWWRRREYYAAMKAK